MILTTAELATELKLHPETIRRMVRRGQIQAYSTSTGARGSFRFILKEVRKALRRDTEYCL